MISFYDDQISEMSRIFFFLIDYFRGEIMNQGNGKVRGVVVDAGHGGADPGAVANGLREKDFTLEASRYMYERFRELGIPAVMTRTDDESITRDQRVSTMINSFGATPDVLVLANHINAGGGEGAEVYYPLRSDGVLARDILDSIEQAGQIGRGTFQRTLPEDPTKDYYYIMRLTPDTTALLIEYGYIDNSRDVVKLQQNLLRYVEAVVKAVANYGGFTYTPPTDSSQGGTYVVEQGDSLWSIANRYGTTVATLMQLNNLTTDVLQIGQILLLPTGTGTSTSTYIVQRGDSLWSIAQANGVSVNDLINANNLTTNVLQIGQVLQIPAGNQSESQGVTTYTVQQGDSLWSIANRFNTTVADLRRANSLTTDVLQIGQILKIPAESSSGTTTYTVQSGDTLWGIANRYGTTVLAIMNLNNLGTTILQIGQILEIPV